MAMCRTSKPSQNRAGGDQRPKDRPRPQGRVWRVIWQVREATDGRRSCGYPSRSCRRAPAASWAKERWGSLPMATSVAWSGRLGCVEAATRGAASFQQWRIQSAETQAP